ncbi:MAG TPA: hypothetical protein VGA73_16055, partial [Candidatus Binatia bacterium]
KNNSLFDLESHRPGAFDEKRMKTASASLSYRTFISLSSFQRIRAKTFREGFAGHVVALLPLGMVG